MTQRTRAQDTRQFSDEKIATADISRIQIITGQLQDKSHQTVVGQLTVWYGQNQSQPHGKCLSLSNKRTHDLNLKSGQRIREILVFRSFDQKYVTGLQFKVNGHATEIYGSESRRVQPLRSLYNSDLVYCQYFNGTADGYLLSLNAHFGSASIKSPFCASRTTTPVLDNSSYGTMSSNDSRCSNDEHYGTTQSEPLQRFDLEKSYNSVSSGHYSLNSHSLTSLQDAPLHVRELGHQTTRQRQNHYYGQLKPNSHYQAKSNSHYQPPKLAPTNSYYVGSTRNHHPAPPVHGQSSLALGRPIHARTYDHSNV